MFEENVRKLRAGQIWVNKQSGFCYCLIPAKTLDGYSTSFEQNFYSTRE